MILERYERLCKERGLYPTFRAKKPQYLLGFFVCFETLVSFWYHFCLDSHFLLYCDMCRHLLLL